ncbi:hypothetical protein [Vibrio scophthalmi]|uniref:Uncharacterized protein n=1 Tax=Vibrio scophthalmi TaxID=45658 RepID=A0A1E3WEQ2_9VIBR|nr:hypothetical protein [Vibrio scophthalmi]ODS04283.1 hypothetical protein VSF3289_03414 [Vibrio scophthalmi]
MEPLVRINSLLDIFISTIKSEPDQSKMTKEVIDIAERLSEQLSDPFAIWSDKVDDSLVKQLFAFRNVLKQLQLGNSKLNTHIAQIRRELLNAIDSFDNNQIHKNKLTLDPDYQGKSSSPATLGFIQQLSTRQDELNDAIAVSLQQIDERTGAAERHVGRVERNAIRAFRQESSELNEVHLDNIKTQVIDGIHDIENTVSTASSKLSLSLRESTDSLVKQYQEEYDSLYRELNNKTNEQIKQTDEIRSEFDRKIIDLNRAFEEQAIELNHKFETEKKQFQVTLLESVKEEVASYNSVRRQLRIQLDEAKDIVGVLSKKAMAHEHLEQARHEACAYWGFQVTGLVFLFAAILMSVAIFGDSLGLRLPWLNWLVEFSSASGAIQIQGTTGGISAGGNTDMIMDTNTSSETAWFFKRISIVLLLTAPGLYLLKEAANHRVKENLYRQRGVQLASITPYLKELDESDRNAIKKDLVKSFFSFHDGKADSQNVPDFLRDLKETTKIIRTIDRATQPSSNRRVHTQRRKRQPQSTQG